MWVVNGVIGGELGANTNVNHTMGFKLDLRIAVKETKMRARTNRPVARFGKIMVGERCTCNADDAPKPRLRCAGVEDLGQTGRMPAYVQSPGSSVASAERESLTVARLAWSCNVYSKRSNPKNAHQFNEPRLGQLGAITIAIAK